MIETTNLQLIPCQLEHLQALSRSKDELGALLGVRVADGWPHFPEAYSPDGYMAGAWSTYLYIDTADQMLVGSGGFKGAPDRVGTVEIGYEIASEYQNRGYATEAARGLVEFAFTLPEVQAVRADTLAAFNPSRRVLQKIGMRFEGSLMDLEEGWVWRWRISRADYEQKGIAALSEISYKTDCDGIDWQALNARLKADNFDNGRTDAQLRLSFENSRRVVFAMRGGEVIGKARAISDGVGNAYVVDVWTFSPYRKQGIGKQIMDCLLDGLQGQHVYLFTDDAVEFYERIGWQRQGVGLFRVVGEYLQNESRAVE